MTEDSKAYWAWLQLSLGEGSFKTKTDIILFSGYTIILRCNPMAFDGIIYLKELKQLSQNTLEDGKILIDSSESKRNSNHYSRL